jgi:hypothetical protein
MKGKSTYNVAERKWARQRRREPGVKDIPSYSRSNQPSQAPHTICLHNCFSYPLLTKTNITDKLPTNPLLIVYIRVTCYPSCTGFQSWQPEGSIFHFCWLLECMLWKATLTAQPESMRYDDYISLSYSIKFKILLWFQSPATARAIWRMVHLSLQNCFPYSNTALTRTS